MDYQWPPGMDPNQPEESPLPVTDKTNWESRQLLMGCFTGKGLVEALNTRLTLDEKKQLMKQLFIGGEADDPHWDRTIKTLEKAASNINQRVVIEAYGARLLLKALGLTIPEPKPEPKPMMVWRGHNGGL